jgi:streptogramin lyase
MWGTRGRVVASLFARRNNRRVRGISTRLGVIAAGVVLLGSCVFSTDYPVPGGFPWGTAFDARGSVWVAMPGCDPSPMCSGSTPPGKLALFDPDSHNWSTVSLPSGYGQPLFVEVDQAGKVWFTMPVTNAIGRYDPISTLVTQWPIPTVSGGPWDLDIDGTGKVWFTEHYTNKIGSFDPGSHTFQEVSTPAGNSNPYGIAVDAANNIWFTENPDSVARIGEYTNQRILKEYKIRTTPTAGTGLTPHLITLDLSGNVWWSEGWVSGIGKLNVAAAQPGTNAGVTEHFYTPSCGSCGSHTSGIDADKQGLIWLDDSLQNTFGSFPVGGGSFSFYNSPSGGHPHDGLNVDAQNRIWFDEEFANRLAVAVQSGSSTSSIDH